MENVDQEKRPEWLQQFSKQMSEAKEKIQALEDKIKTISYDKGARLELNPPGYRPRFGKSFFGQQMEQLYREQIAEVKNSTYDKSTELLKTVNENERLKYVEEIQNNLSYIKPQDRQPELKEEVKDIDQSQTFMKDGLREFDKRAGEKESRPEQGDKKLSADKVEPPEASQEKAEHLFSKHQENKNDITTPNIVPPDMVIDRD